MPSLRRGDRFTLAFASAAMLLATLMGACTSTPASAVSASPNPSSALSTNSATVSQRPSEPNGNLDLSPLGTILLSLLGSAVVSGLIAAYSAGARDRARRRQRRLEKAYLTMSEFVLEWREWTDVNRPLSFQDATASPPQDPPDDSEARRIEARISAYGSPVIRSKFRQFLATARDLRERNHDIRDLSGREGFEATIGDLGLRQDHAAGDVLSQADSILDLANAELAERGSHVRWPRRRRGSAS